MSVDPNAIIEASYVCEISGLDSCLLCQKLQHKKNNILNKFICGQGEDAHPGFLIYLNCFRKVCCFGKTLEAGNLLIEKGWMQQSPSATDHESLAKN